MLDRTTKLRLRRLYRRRRRQVEDLGSTAEEGLEQHFIRRLTRLAEVRRFVITWILLVLLLITGVVLQARALGKYYQVVKPQPGGVYTEGILGQFTDANPLYAAGSVDSAVSHLLFAGLFKYDQHNALVGDLAKSYEVDDKGVTYTIHLRPDLTWHDGQPLTSQDVMFTYTTIQNPDTRSPLASSWTGVKMEAPDPLTIVFHLPNPFSAFPETLNNGIVPKHLLNGIPVTRLRSIAFNTAHPIGSGPFKWQAIEVVGADPAAREQRIALVPFDNYHDNKPKLSRFIIRAFSDEQQLIKSVEKQELTGAAGLSSVPAGVKDNPTIRAYNVPLTGEVMAFFRNSNEILQDVKVRKALVMATNTPAVIKAVGYPVIAANEPLLKSHLGYDKTFGQLGYDTAAANKLLDEAGWLRGPDGIRTKAGKPLDLRLFSQDTNEYTAVTSLLKKQWQAIGVETEVLLQPESDLQTTISFHNYDVLVYGIAIGSDPDVFAYWHSSQADIRSATHLNLSEYKSGVADQSLEAGRTRSDPALRAAKYKPFLQAWRDDAPALALYQPRFLYITRGTVYGFEPKVLNASSDRFSNIQNWMIRQTRTAKD